MIKQKEIAFDCMHSEICRGCADRKAALTDFIDSSLESISQIKRSVNLGVDFDFYKNLIRLRKSALSVGALGLAENCRELEAAAHQTHRQKISEVFPIFESQFELAMAYAVEQIVSIARN